jgi:hypothetical protein
MDILTSERGSDAALVVLPAKPAFVAAVLVVVLFARVLGRCRAASGRPRSDLLRDAAADVFGPEFLATARALAVACGPRALAAAVAVEALREGAVLVGCLLRHESGAGLAGCADFAAVRIFSHAMDAADGAGAPVIPFYEMGQDAAELVGEALVLLWNGNAGGGSTSEPPPAFAPLQIFLHRLPPVRVGLSSGLAGGAAVVLAGVAGGRGGWPELFHDCASSSSGVVTPSSSSDTWTSFLSPGPPAPGLRRGAAFSRPAAIVFTEDEPERISSFPGNGATGAIACSLDVEAAAEAESSRATRSRSRAFFGSPLPARLERS